MTIRPIFSVVQGISYGLVSAELKRLEGSVRAGGNNCLTALFQIAQGGQTLGFVTKANTAAGLPPFSWAGKSTLYLSPILLAVLKNTTLVPETIRPVITFFYHNLGTLYQIAAVISSIALLFFGQAFFAIPSLLTLGLGILDQNGWLPVGYRQFLHRYSQPFLMVTGLVSGGIVERAFTVMNILSWCANAYLSQKPPGHEEFVFQENLTPQRLIDFFQGSLDVRINPKFIQYNPFPPVPNIDIQYLIEKFDQTDWRGHLPMLRQKLRHDARFVERHRTPDLKTDQEIMDITRDSLQLLIDTVKGRRILEGEPADYEKLHNYLKIVTQSLVAQDNGVSQIDILCRLAVEGGGYCGPGKFEVAESVYAQTMGEDPDIPFRDKIAYCLQDERNLWMQKFYALSFTQSPIGARIGQIIDRHDVHNYNTFINLYGDEFGLRKAAAENDDTALIDPLTKWIISWTLKGRIQRAFWNEHSLNHHTQILIDSIGTPKLPRPELYAFWQNWIERQYIDEPAKEILREELATGRLYGRPLEMDRECTPEFVTLMLLDMGIVEIV